MLQSRYIGSWTTAIGAVEVVQHDPGGRPEQHAGHYAVAAATDGDQVRVGCVLLDHSCRVT